MEVSSGNCAAIQSNDLNKPAIIDGNRTYTYGQMFREWERYATVFTSLGMTEVQKARVGVLGFHLCRCYFFHFTASI